MARQAPLRTVKPGEKPPAARKRPLTLAQAIESGTYLDILEAQRREIARDIKGEKGPAKAAMHRQLALLSKEIEELKVKALEDVDDDDDVAPEPWSEAAL